MSEAGELTLSEVLRRIEWDTDKGRSSMARFLAVDENRILLSGSDGNRPKFPESAVPYFQQIKERYEARKMSPKDGPAFIRELMAQDPAAIVADYSEKRLIENPTETIKVNKPINRKVDYSDTANPSALIQQLADAIRKPSKGEAWLTLKAASEEFGISQRTIKENVPYTMDRTRRKYKRSRVEAFASSVTDYQPGSEPKDNLRLIE